MLSCYTIAFLFSQGTLLVSLKSSYSLTSSGVYYDGFGRLSELADIATFPGSLGKYNTDKGKTYHVGLCTWKRVCWFRVNLVKMFRQSLHPV